MGLCAIFYCHLVFRRHAELISASAVNNQSLVDALLGDALESVKVKCLGRWDTLENKSWNAMGRSEEVGHNKILNVLDCGSPPLGTFRQN